MDGIFKKVKSCFGFLAVVFACFFAFATNSFAAFTLPEMPVTQIEAAGAAVAALVIAGVLIGAVLRIVRKAG